MCTKYHKWFILLIVIVSGLLVFEQLEINGKKNKRQSVFEKELQPVRMVIAEDTTYVYYVKELK